MPCRDWPDEGTVIRYEDTAKVDRLTRLLCEATEKLENNDLLDDCSKELVDWAHEHTKIDMKRLQAELIKVQDKAKKEWLKTLTDRERELIKGR